MNKFEFLQSKILSKDEIKPILNTQKFKGRKIVFSNGCFDILHRGHIEYLAKASSLGNLMIIGLNTDNSVKRLKGQSRPVQDEVSRSQVMASLHFVDYVVLFDEDTPFDLINFVKPDILVKGSDYKENEIIGADIVKENGGRVVTIDLVNGYSTSSIIEHLKK